jgi:SPP1 family predicted phage head-tail adaptor
MRGGKLDRRIVLQQATTTYDALNNPVKTWATLATVWASKTDLSDTERVQAAEVGADMTTRFQIRHSNTVSVINPKDRLTYAGNTYQIVAVKEIGRNEGYEITAVVRTD